MTGVSTSCGACKFLRRKCTNECVFAPYFSYDEAAIHFSAVHKVFGASNVSRLLFHLPEQRRCEAALSITYEALARMRDPVYGCVSYIYALQAEVANLQEEIDVLGNHMSNLNIQAPNDDCGSAQALSYNTMSTNSSQQLSTQESSMDLVEHYFTHINRQREEAVPTNSIAENITFSRSQTVISDETSMLLPQQMSINRYHEWEGHNLVGFSNSRAQERLVNGVLNQENNYDILQWLANQ